MDKTTSINLGGLNFIIEESAHEKLVDYLKTVKKHLGKDIDQEEVMADIESSMAEKLKNNLTSYKEVITNKDIEALISVMGTAEDFNREVGPEEENTQTKDEDEPAGIKRKLYRDTDNAIISGVSAGLAAYFDVDPIVFRLLFVALVFANGFGLLAYLIFWIAMPEAKTASQKLEMHGQTPTIASLEKLSKFGKDLKANSRKHWQQLSAFGKIFYLPFMLLGRFWEGFKKLWSKIWPIIRFTFGLFLIGGTFVGLITVGTGSLYLLLQTYSDYRISFIPIADLISTIPFSLIVTSAFLALAIPIILLLLAGISIVRRKNSLSFTMAAILIAIWMVATIAGSALALNYVPEVVNRVNNYPTTQMTSIKITGSEAKELLVNGNIQIIIDPQGNQPAVLEGRLVDLEGIETKYENNRLTLAKKNIHEQKCLDCIRQSVTLKIGGKNLNKVTAIDGAYVNLKNIDQPTLEVNSSNGSYIDLTGQISNLKLTANQANIVANSASSELIDTSILASDSEIVLAGQTKKLIIHSSNTDKYTSIIANKLSSQEVELLLDSPLTIISGQSETINFSKGSTGILFHQNSKLNNISKTWLISNYQPLDSFEYSRQLEKTNNHDYQKSITYKIIGNEEESYLIKKDTLTPDELERMSIRFSSALNLDRY